MQTMHESKNATCRRRFFALRHILSRAVTSILQACGAIIFLSVAVFLSFILTSLSDGGLYRAIPGTSKPRGPWRFTYSARALR